MKRFEHQVKACLALSIPLCLMPCAWAAKYVMPLTLAGRWNEALHVSPGNWTFMTVIGLVLGLVTAVKAVEFGPIVTCPATILAAFTVTLLLYVLLAPWVPGIVFVGVFLVLCVLFFFGFTMLWHGWFSKGPSKSHGSAAWSNAKTAEIKGRLQEKGYVLADSHGFALGRVPGATKRQDSRLRYTGHVLTCAPTGAGKGIGAVIPNLLEYPGSALVLDIKGENYAVTHRAREAMGQAVFLLDPFGVTGEAGHSLNWLDRLNPDDPNVVSESAMLAEMLVIPDSQGDSYWDEAVKDLLRGLMVHVAGLPEEERHMGEVRRLITHGEVLLRQTLDAMTLSEAGFGVVARTAHAFLGKAEKDRSGVLSAAIRHTTFLDDPRIVECLQQSDFNLSELKSSPMTVYVAMPPAKLSAYNRFLRGLVGLSLAAITESNQRPEYNVAFFLDEFAQLGRMSAIEDAISLVRGYGASFWIFVQDLSQLKGVYPKWQTFLANTAKQFFGTADLDTARYISQTLGELTLSYSTRGRSVQDMQWHGSSSTNQQFMGRALLTPDEVMRLGPMRPIVLISGERPYLLERLNYLNDSEYAGLAEENPFHRQKVPQ